MNSWKITGAGLGLLLIASLTAKAVGAPTDDTKQAVAFVTLLADQKYQDADDQFDARVKAALSADKLKTVWDQTTGQLGTFKTTGQTKTADSHGLTVEFVETVFEHGSLWVQVVYDEDGKIGGLHFLPKTEQPSHS